LAERDCIQELGTGHPMVSHHCVVLHQGNDHKTPAIGQRSDLYGHPRQRGETTYYRHGGGGQQEEGCSTRDGSKAAPDGYFDKAATKKNQDQEGTDGGRRNAASQEI
jgi:hypothetical protein